MFIYSFKAKTSGNYILNPPPPVCHMLRIRSWCRVYFSPPPAADEIIVSWMWQLITLFASSSQTSQSSEPRMVTAMQRICESQSYSILTTDFISLNCIIFFLLVWQICLKPDESRRSRCHTAIVYSPSNQPVFEEKFSLYVKRTKRNWSVN